MAASMACRQTLLKATTFLRNTAALGRTHGLQKAQFALTGQRFMSSDGVRRENIPISRFSIPKVSSLPQDIRDRINDVDEKTGFVPNVFKVLSRRPAEFNAFFDYYETLMSKETGSLTNAERELIVVSTSAFNNCLYCVVSHSAFHRVFSKDPYVADQVATNKDFATLTPRERAIVDFAVNISEMNPIEDVAFEVLEQHGLSREDIWDVGAIAAFFSLSNRMANLTAMMPNEEFYLMGRVPKSET